jgi:hypothetical protein
MFLSLIPFYPCFCNANECTIPSASLEVTERGRKARAKRKCLLSREEGEKIYLCKHSLQRGGRPEKGGGGPVVVFFHPYPQARFIHGKLFVRSP